MNFSALYFRKPMLVLGLLGFSSGLPLALSGATLQAWLTVEGLDLKTIGFFALVGLPYTFKFAWAPLLDRFDLPGFPRRKGWMVLCPALIGLICLLMSSLKPAEDLYTLGGLAVLLAFISASHDVVFDAYRNELLDADERGAGAAVSVFAYRVAMLVSGGLALMLADWWLGWQGLFQALALVFGLLSLAVLWVPSVSSVPAKTSAWAEWRGFVVMLVCGITVYGIGAPFAPSPIAELSLRANQFIKLAFDSVLMLSAFAAALWAARRVRFPSLMAPWDAFFAQPLARALLMLVVFYKLGDAFAGALSTAFLLRGLGFSAAEVGAVNKALGLAATIIGALVGGWYLARQSLAQSLWPALWWFGIAQAMSNLLYWLLAVSEKSYALMASAIAIENLCGGMGTAAFVALLMTLTDRRFSASQFALLSALAAVGRVYVGPSAGVLAEQFGWPSFFALTVLTALPGLALLYVLRQRIEVLAKSAACNNSDSIKET